MAHWLKTKTELQRLQNQYCRLMKSSFIIALKDKEKSDVINQKANTILVEIKKLQQHY